LPTTRWATTERRTFSTLLGLEVVDSDNQAWDVALALVDRPNVEGDYQPGETKRGWATFEVPDASTGLKLRVKGSVTATGSLFALS
jgi:hypothetical protein